MAVIAITSANYTTVTGFQLANDTIAIDVTTTNSVQQIDLQSTNGTDVEPGDTVNIYPLIFGVNDGLAGVDINFIKFSDAISSVGFSLQATFNFYMASNGGTTIGVSAGVDGDPILMGMYDNPTVEHSAVHRYRGWRQRHQYAATMSTWLASSRCPSRTTRPSAPPGCRSSISRRLISMSSVDLLG